MNVLSLFDGISCGRVALERANIPVSKYYASEIDKSAISVTMDNYPDTIQLGNINEIQKWRLNNIELLIGGSPCQDMSKARVINGKQITGLKGERSKLFLRYLEALHKFNPKYFLFENVDMPTADKELISFLLGVEPIEINSNLVSFQNRNRLYWTNISKVTRPKDKNISYQNFKDSDFEYCSRFKVPSTPSRIKMWGDGFKGSCPNVTNKEKINCITLKQDRYKNAGLVEFDGFCRYLTTRELELAQTLPVGYTKLLSIRQAEKAIGNGWTVDVIAHILSALK